MEEKLGPESYFTGFFDKVDDIEESLEPYNQASKSYKQTFNKYISGECGAEQVKAAMRRLAFTEQQLVRDGLGLQKLLDDAYRDLSNARPEDLVSLSTENSLAKIVEAEDSDYTPSERDFIQAINAVEGNTRVLGDEDDIVVDGSVEEAIDYSWRDAFRDIELEEPEGLRVSDSHLEDSREEVLGLEEGDLEEKRQEVRGREPRYIH